MQKRNLILLIILVLIILGVVYVYFSGGKSGDDTATDNTDTNFFSTLFPFFKSSNNTTDEKPADVSGYVPPADIETKPMVLRKVSDLPVAGYGVFMKERFVEVPLQIKEEEGSEGSTAKPTPPETELAPLVRYVNRENGNIYETFADKITEKKFSNTLIPQVREAFFGKDGRSVIMRYLKTDDKTIATWTGELPEEALGADSVTTRDAVGSFLPEDILDLSISGELSKMFYLLKFKNGVVGITADTLGDRKLQVFSSAFTEWLSQFPNNDLITLTSKPASSVAGFMYTVNPSRADFRRVLGGINGLTTLTSPSGKLVLYADDKLSLNIYNIQTGAHKKISIKTLPEKCVWEIDGSEIYCAMPKYLDNALYPDQWYQGEVSFRDQIWSIDPETLNTGLLLDPTQAETPVEIDATKLSLQDGYLFFINKKDSKLWELQLR